MDRKNPRPDGTKRRNTVKQSYFGTGGENGPRRISAGTAIILGAIAIGATTAETFLPAPKTHAQQVSTFVFTGNAKEEEASKPMDGDKAVFGLALKAFGLLASL